MRGITDMHAAMTESMKPAIQQLPIILSEWTRHHDGREPIFHLNWHAMQWVSTIVAIVLLLQDRTDWRADIIKELLVPYIAITLPDPLLDVLRGEPGRWVGLVGLLVRLFYPDYFPRDMDMPLALLLLLIIAPGNLLDTKNSPAAIIVALLIVLLLLFQHVTSVGGLQRAFTEKRALPSTLLLIIMAIIPVLMLVVSFT